MKIVLKKPEVREASLETNPPPETSSDLVELESLPEDLPPVPEPAVQPEVWTDALMRTYDFTGWDFNKLPHGTVKAARNGGPSVVVGQAECAKCGRKMWVCNSKLEDLCEEDEYRWRAENWDKRVEQVKRQRTLKPHNPFSNEPSEISRAFWPREKF